MKIQDIAEAVKTQLAAATFTQTPAAYIRGYHPTIELKNAGQLTLVIVPRSQTRERNDETGWDVLTTIDVGILFKFPVSSSRDLPNANVDPYDALAEEIVDHFGSDDYTGPDNQDVEAITRDPLFVPDHLQELRQFTSVVSVQFREVIG